MLAYLLTLMLCNRLQIRVVALGGKVGTKWNKNMAIYIFVEHTRTLCSASRLDTVAKSLYFVPTSPQDVAQYMHGPLVKHSSMVWY